MISFSKKQFMFKNSIVFTYVGRGNLPVPRDKYIMKIYNKSLL